MVYLLIYKSDDGAPRTRQKYFICMSYAGTINNIDRPFPHNSFSNTISGLFINSDIWNGLDLEYGTNAYCNDFGRYSNTSDFEGSGGYIGIPEIPIYEFNCENGYLKKRYNRHNNKKFF